MEASTLTLIADEFPELHPYATELRRISRACVDIEIGTSPISNASSRFGGLPFVPPDFEWPVHAAGEYRFLGQINFSEIQTPPSPLPSKGLLCLFYLHDENGNAFWQDDGFVIGMYWDDNECHQLVPSPKDPPAIACALTLTPGFRLPERRELIELEDFDEEALEALTTGVPEIIHRTDQWMLGYPRYDSLCYDPTPGPGWIPLLTLPSLDAFDWCWHDGNMLMIFIETTRLATADFSGLKCDAG